MKVWSEKMYTFVLRPTMYSKSIIFLAILLYAMYIWENTFSHYTLTNNKAYLFNKDKVAIPLVFINEWINIREIAMWKCII